MIKSKELSDQTSCLNRADPEEPIFVLLGRDVAAPDSIRKWVSYRIACNKNKPGDPQLDEALLLANQMEAWERERRSTKEKP